MPIKENIHIKGTKDGLVFLLNDECTFKEILEELKDKLENSHHGILTGPLMRVTIKTGYRKLTSTQEKNLKDAFKSKGNLLIHAIDNEVELSNEKEKEKDKVQVVNTTIRSGQMHQFEGNILFVGDINPGGHLLATGDVYVLGALRGIVHAGFDGNEDAVIVASIMEPTQLRIANIISYPSEDGNKKENRHQFAYVQDKQIILESIHHFSMIKKGLDIFT